MTILSNRIMVKDPIQKTSGPLQLRFYGIKEGLDALIQRDPLLYEGADWVAKGLAL
jgi:hypothetical protein